SSAALHRRVVARQRGQAIFEMSVSLRVPAGDDWPDGDGGDRQQPMPPVPGPEEADADLDALYSEWVRSPDGRWAWDRSRSWKPPRSRLPWSVLDVRYVGNSVLGGLPDEPDRPSRLQVWMRANAPLPADHVI